ncbi:MAG TPA: hypothetical protein PL070_16970, partial [Flavobacteriales bacterium]|nr:hypothetical protein [Flavobacteriales bacterium]
MKSNRSVHHHGIFGGTSRNRVWPRKPHISALAKCLTLLMHSDLISQELNLGIARSETKVAFQKLYENTNRYFASYPRLSLSASLIDKGDTLVYRTSGADETRIELIFSYAVCEQIILEFTCFTCLEKEYRKELFKGEWRVAEDGYLYRLMNPARASIQRAVDCPYLYKVDIRSMEQPLTRDS